MPTNDKIEIKKVIVSHPNGEKKGEYFLGGARRVLKKYGIKVPLEILKSSGPPRIAIWWAVKQEDSNIPAEVILSDSFTDIIVFENFLKELLPRPRHSPLCH